MEIINGPQSTIISLRIEEDLDYILKGLELLESITGPPQPNREINALIRVIKQCNPRKNIQLRFT